MADPTFWFCHERSEDYDKTAKPALHRHFQFIAHGHHVSDQGPKPPFAMD